MGIIAEEKKKWANYLKQCPKQDILDFEDGDIFYLEKMHNDDKGNLKGSKFRPAILINGKTLLKHPQMTSQFSHQIHRSNIYVIPTTTKLYHNVKNKNEFKEDNLELTPFNLQFTEGKIEYHENPKNPKTNYTRPMNLYTFTEIDVQKMLDMADHHDPALQQRKIGHIEKHDLSRLIDTIGQCLYHHNQRISEKNQHRFKLTHMHSNPTRLALKIRQPSLEATFKPAFNDPDLT